MRYIWVVAQSRTTLFKVLISEIKLFVTNLYKLPNCFIRICPLLSRRLLLFLRLLTFVPKRLKPQNICNSGKYVNQNSRKCWHSSLFLRLFFFLLSENCEVTEIPSADMYSKKRGKEEYKERGMFLYSPLTHQPNTTPITNTVDTRFTSILTQTIAPSIIPLTTFNIYSALQDMIDSFI